jgi:hypothetical protein
MKRRKHSKRNHNDLEVPCEPIIMMRIIVKHVWKESASIKEVQEEEEIMQILHKL